MKITSVSIRGFRNLREVDVSPSAHFNVFISQNGQGKTNFLEAIYSTLRGKSFRPYVTRPNWIPNSQDADVGTSVQLKIENTRGFETDLNLKFEESAKWSLRLNGKRISPIKIHEHVPVVAFSPEDHAIIRGSPELRRSFLDEVFADVCPGYSDVLTRFTRALKQRNLLLKRAGGSRHPLGPEMKAWTHLLAETGLELIELRSEVWPTFETNYRNVASRLLSDFAAEIELRYESNLEGIPASETKGGAKLGIDAYVRFIEERLDADLATGWTHRGPHRDDFSIFLDGVESRAGASQGQARLLALVLKWVHAEWVRKERRELPIFLIDDFSSELDAKRRRLLLSLVSELSGQVFVTSTDDSLMASIVDFEPFSQYTLFGVEKGSIKVSKL